MSRFPASSIDQVPRRRRSESRASFVGRLQREGLGTEEINRLVQTGGETQTSIEQPSIPLAGRFRPRGQTQGERLEEFRDRAAFLPPDEGLDQSPQVQEIEARRRNRVLTEQRMDTPVEGLGGLTPREFREQNRARRDRGTHPDLTPQQFLATRRRPGETAGDFVFRIEQTGRELGLTDEQVGAVVEQSFVDVEQEREQTPEQQLRQQQRRQQKLQSATSATERAIRRRAGSDAEFEEMANRANENIRARNPDQPLIETRKVRREKAQEARNQRRRELTEQFGPQAQPQEPPSEFHEFTPQQQAQIQGLQERYFDILNDAIEDGVMDEDEEKALNTIARRIGSFKPRFNQARMRERGENPIMVGDVPFFFNPTTQRLQRLPMEGGAPQTDSERKQAEQQEKADRKIVDQAMRSETVKGALFQLGLNKIDQNSVNEIIREEIRRIKAENQLAERFQNELATERERGSQFGDQPFATTQTQEIDGGTQGAIVFLRSQGFEPDFVDAAGNIQSVRDIRTNQPIPSVHRQEDFERMLADGRLQPGDTFFNVFQQKAKMVPEIR